MTDVRTETDSLGEVHVAADKLCGAQAQRSHEHFSIGHDLIPREMITAYAVLKKAAANGNHAGELRTAPGSVRVRDLHDRPFVDRPPLRRIVCL
jgi:fumarate hydratase class II